MSFWDRIKPSTRPPAVVDARASEDGGRLLLAWDDGHRTEAAARALRLACPCASCVDEWTNQRTLDPESVPGDVRLGSVEAVGNYALRLVFTDGHATGLYSWPVLRAHTAPPTVR